MISKVETYHYDDKEIRIYHYDDKESRILHPVNYRYNNKIEKTELDSNDTIPWSVKKKMKKDLPVLLDDTIDRRKFYDRYDLLKVVTPSWVNKEDIKKIYDEAKRLTEETGVKHHVDHIIPLNHSLVCGLHVVANLRVITQEENYKKNNKFIIE